MWTSPTREKSVWRKGAVTVKNAIPGQKIEFMINKKRSGRLEGRLLKVLEKSPLETRDPVCSIFPRVRRLHVPDHEL